MEIKCIYKNYGKLEDVNFEDKDINILLLSGENKAGKSTVRHSFNEMFSGKSIKKVPLKDGEDSGMVELHIPDKNNDTVIVKHNFNKVNEKGKFTITDIKGKTFNTKEKLREILGYYNELSLADMFQLTRSTQGTQKFIREYIYGNLTDKAKKQLEDIDKLIKPNSGSLYLDRTVKGRELTKAKQQPIREFTETELKAILQLDKAEKRVIKLQEEVNAYDSRVLRNEAQKRIIHNNVLRITEHEEKIKQLKEENVSTKKTIIELKSIEETKVTLNNGRTFIESVKELESLKTQSDYNKAYLEEIIETHEEIEESIVTYRKDRLRLLSSVKLPEGLIVDDETGKVVLNGREFTSTETSESEAMLILANLKCEMEDAKLIDMGNISIYDNNALKEISALAKKHGKLVLLEKVEGSELKFVNYIVE